MKPSTAPPADPAILEALRLRARGQAALGFADFMDVALYDPGAGYYRRGGPRIGYGPGTDFLTASASAPLFGRRKNRSAPYPACRDTLPRRVPSNTRPDRDRHPAPESSGACPRPTTGSRTSP